MFQKLLRGVLVRDRPPLGGRPVSRVSALRAGQGSVADRLSLPRRAIRTGRYRDRLATLDGVGLAF